MNARELGSLSCVHTVCCCMHRLCDTSTKSDSAVANWRRLFVKQRGVRKVRRLAVVLVSYCKDFSGLRWGPAVAKDPVAFSRTDRLRVFAVEAVKGVLRSDRFRAWCADSSVVCVQWFIGFCRDPVNKGSKLISVVYLAHSVYRWAFSTPAASQ